MSVITRDEVIEEIGRWMDRDAAGDSIDKDALRDLIAAGLDLEYVSESNRGGIETGNHYQSVSLGDEVTHGFRSDRQAVLDQIDFRGRTVLDLGSNLGELSRAARARGAARVVGVEYDEFFVAIARGLNLLNDVEHVDFRHGDIGAAGLYEERFDIVLAFSVFQYVGPVIDAVCRATGQILVVETHKLEDNLLTDYVAPVARHLPSVRVLGTSDWGATTTEPGERAVVAFARDEATLGDALIAAAPEVASEPDADLASVDVERTSRSLHRDFFGAFDFASLDELFEAVATTSVDLAAMGRNANVLKGYRGWLYWFIYLKGYLEYVERGRVEHDNTFCRYLSAYHAPTVDDPGGAEEAAEPVVLRRFRDLDAMRAAAGGERPPPALAPLQIMISDPLPPAPLVITLESRRTVHAALLDGWHRLFAAAVCGIPRLAAELVYETYPPVEGRIERYDVTGDGTLRLAGWCFSPRRPTAFIELRTSGVPLARERLLERPDVGAGYPESPHAAASGFSFTCPVPPKDFPTLDVVPVTDWLPVGRMRLWRTEGVRDIDELGAATAAGAAITAIAPMLRSDGPVLAIGPVAGEISRAVLPDADVEVVGEDPSDWPGDGGARLVVAADPLPPMPEPKRYVWLEGAACALLDDGALIVRDQRWLPRDLPPTVRLLFSLPAEPVSATSTAVLVRM